MKLGKNFKKNYLIVAVGNDAMQRSILNNVETKLEAMRSFNKIYPEFLIISISELNGQERDWMNKNNMPNNEDIDI